MGHEEPSHTVWLPGARNHPIGFTHEAYWVVVAILIITVTVERVSGPNRNTEKGAK